MNNIYELEKSTDSDSSREKTIIRTSIIGIIANVFLAAFKAVIGIMTHSIAIVLDAVNNISDAGSSLITIVGTKLAGKEPDKKHPFGYGRIEYLSAMIISVIVLYAGITSFVESGVHAGCRRYFHDLPHITGSVARRDHLCRDHQVRY